MGICSISLCRLTFPCKDPFVLPGQPRAGDSAFGRQLCHGACTCAFFLFWPPASGGRLNNHPGVPPESQDEEGQEAHPGDGKQGGGGDTEEVHHHVVSLARAGVKCQYSVKQQRVPESPSLPLRVICLFRCVGLSSHCPKLTNAEFSRRRLHSCGVGEQFQAPNIPRELSCNPNDVICCGKRLALEGGDWVELKTGSPDFVCFSLPRTEEMSLHVEPGLVQVRAEIKSVDVERRAWRQITFAGTGARSLQPLCWTWRATSTTCLHPHFLTQHASVSCF